MIDPKITKAKKRVEVMRPGYFLVWRSRDKHNAGQSARTMRWKDKTKSSKK